MTPLARLLRVLASALPVVVLGAAADGRASPDRPFQDCADCPWMVSIPAGRFLMGVARGEEDAERLADEFRHRSEPAREVAVPAFAASRHEITRGQFRAFVDATQHRADGCFVWTGTEFTLDPGRNWRNPGFAQDDSHAVVCVSWEDANAYAQWLGRKTGRPYRLLSEAEWEYAARAGSAAPRFWGGDPALGCGYANGADHTTQAQAPGTTYREIHPCSDGYAHTAPVGSFRANGFGLHDMLGNAAEWTQDCWNVDYRGARSDAVAASSGDCTMRAVRGGAWDEGPAGLRTAYRVGSPVTIRVYGRGFRVARQP